ncbi:MAG: hypothetical protein R3C53_25830 [Pirellulaceae bacterium]
MIAADMIGNNGLQELRVGMVLDLRKIIPIYQPSIEAVPSGQSPYERESKP